MLAHGFVFSLQLPNLLLIEAGVACELLLNDGFFLFNFRDLLLVADFHFFVEFALHFELSGKFLLLLVDSRLRFGEFTLHVQLLLSDSLLVSSYAFFDGFLELFDFLFLEVCHLLAKCEVASVFESFLEVVVSDFLVLLFELVDLGQIFAELFVGGREGLFVLLAFAFLFILGLLEAGEGLGRLFVFTRGVSAQLVDLALGFAPLSCESLLLGLELRLDQRAFGAHTFLLFLDMLLEGSDLLEQAGVVVFCVAHRELVSLSVVSDFFLQHGQVLLVLGLLVAHAGLILIDETLHLLGGAFLLFVGVDFKPLLFHLVEILELSELFLCFVVQRGHFPLRVFIQLINFFF